MSKTKKDTVPHYEILFIISNKLSEEEALQTEEKIKKTIKNNQGKITFSENWGKKRLAYPIAGEYYGYYGVLEFDLIKENVAKLDYTLRMTPNVVRHLIIAKKIKTEEEITKEKEILQKITTKTLTKEKEIEAKQSKEEERDKIALNDLDEKLDKILDTESLL